MHASAWTKYAPRSPSQCQPHRRTPSSGRVRCTTKATGKAANTNTNIAAIAAMGSHLSRVGKARKRAIEITRARETRGLEKERRRGREYGSWESNRERESERDEDKEVEGKGWARDGKRKREGGKRAEDEEKLE
eukprot:6176122-Pleurochrysis_carterae.AAC.3